VKAVLIIALFLISVTELESYYRSPASSAETTELKGLEQYSTLVNFTHDED
jgi:hypothetical protein